MNVGLSSLISAHRCRQTGDGVFEDTGPFLWYCNYASHPSIDIRPIVRPLDPSRSLPVHVIPGKSLRSCLLSITRSCCGFVGSGLAWSLGVRVFAGRRSSARPGKNQRRRPEGLVRPHAARITMRLLVVVCLSGHTFRHRVAGEMRRRALLTIPQLAGLSNP